MPTALEAVNCGNAGVFPLTQTDIKSPEKSYDDPKDG